MNDDTLRTTAALQIILWAEHDKALGNKIKSQVVVLD
jgi:hypothetical protein